MTAQTLTVTDFVLARIAEDEKAARDDYKTAMTGYLWKHYPEDAYNEIQRTVLGNAKRVLAQCAAMRKIVEESIALDGEYAGIGLSAAIRALASIWSDHPDFREEWRA